MIPKIIHYSWFSGEEMPEAYVQMMDTWKTFLPDYEFRLWDGQALAEANIMFANEAVSVKKWAFAADAIRVYAVYHYGGIWLDCDVAVCKSFNPFLNCRMFIGKENAPQYLQDGCCKYVHTLTSHCFGAEKGHPFLKDCLDYYEGRHFIVSTNENLPQGLRYDMRLMPYMQAILLEKYGYNGEVLNVNKTEVLKDDIHVYPPYYFDSPKYHDVAESVCIHYQFGSWLPLNDGHLDLRMLNRPRKKDIFYYLYTLANMVLAKRGLQIQMMSV